MEATSRETTDDDAWDGRDAAEDGSGSAAEEKGPDTEHRRGNYAGSASGSDSEDSSSSSSSGTAVETSSSDSETDYSGESSADDSGSGMSGDTLHGRLVRERQKRKEARDTIRSLLANVSAFKEAIESEKLELEQALSASHQEKEKLSKALGQKDHEIQQYRDAIAKNEDERRLVQRENMDNLQTLLKEMTLIEDVSTNMADELERERTGRQEAESRLLESAELNDQLQLKLDRARSEVRKLKRQSRRSSALHVSPSEHEDSDKNEESLEEEVLRLRKMLGVEHERLTKIDDLLSRARATAGVARGRKREVASLREEDGALLQAKIILEEQKDQDQKKIAQLEKRVKDLLRSHNMVMSASMRGLPKHFTPPEENSPASEDDADSERTDKKRLLSSFRRKSTKIPNVTSIAFNESPSPVEQRSNAAQSDQETKQSDKISGPSGFKSNKVVIDPVKGLVLVPEGSEDANAGMGPDVAGNTGLGVAPELVAALAASESLSDRRTARRMTIGLVGHASSSQDDLRSPSANSLARTKLDLPKRRSVTTKKATRKRAHASKVPLTVAEPKSFRTNKLVIDTRTGTMVVLGPSESMQSYHQDVPGSSSPKAGDVQPANSAAVPQILPSNSACDLNSVGDLQDPSANIERKVNVRISGNSDHSWKQIQLSRLSTRDELLQQISSELGVRQHTIDKICRLSGPDDESGVPLINDHDASQPLAYLDVYVRVSDPVAGSVVRRGMQRRAVTEVYDRSQLLTSFDEQTRAYTGKSSMYPSVGSKIQRNWESVTIAYQSSQSDKIETAKYFVAIDGSQRISMLNPDKQSRKVSSVTKIGDSHKLITAADRRRTKEVETIQRAWRSYAARVQLNSRRVILVKGRVFALSRLVNDESDFHSAVLEVVQQYAAPIRSQKSLSKRQLTILFSHIEAIQSTSASLFMKLQGIFSAFKNRWEAPELIFELCASLDGTIFSTSNKFIEYCGNITDALGSLGTKNVISAIVRLQTRSNDPVVESFARLRECLERPVHYVSKLMANLERIQQCTFAGTRERQRLQSTLTILKQIDAEAQRSFSTNARLFHVSRCAKFLTNAGNLSRELAEGMHDVERNFVKEGFLLKMCRKECKKRLFVLFSDCLLYAECDADDGPISTFSASWNRKKAKLHRVIWLSARCRVEVSSAALPTPIAADRLSPKVNGGFNIVTPEKSFVCFTNSARERDDWIEALRLAIQSRASSINDSNSNSEVASVHAAVSSSAPVWVPDAEVSACMSCARKFTRMRRRHHCRKCGKCVCARCSSHSVRFRDKPERACDICFRSFAKANMPEHKLSSMENSKHSSESSLETFAANLRRASSLRLLAYMAEKSEVKTEKLQYDWSKRPAQLEPDLARSQFREAVAAQVWLLESESPIRALTSDLIARIIICVIDAEVSSNDLFFERITARVLSIGGVSRFFLIASRCDIVWRDMFSRVYSGLFAQYCAESYSIFQVGMPISFDLLEEGADPLLLACGGLERRWLDRFKSEHNWLFGSAKQNTKISGHDGAITCLSLHLGLTARDTKFALDLAERAHFIVSGSLDSTLIVWRLSLKFAREALTETTKISAGEPIRTLNCFHEVRCCVASPSKDFIVSGGDERCLRLWSFWGNESFSLRRIKTPHPVLCLLGNLSSTAGRTDPMLAGGMSNGDIALFSSNTWEIQSGAVLRGHAGEVVALSNGITNWDEGFSPSDPKMRRRYASNIISAGKDRTVRVWDIAAFRCTNVLQISPAASPLTSFCFDDHLERFIVGDESGLLYVHSLKDGGQMPSSVKCSPGHAILSLQCDAAKVVVTSADGSVRFWDWNSPESVDAVPTLTFAMTPERESDDPDKENAAYAAKFCGGTLVASHGASINISLH